MSRTSKHSGAIKALQFNHYRHELLATAGAKGELYISDLNNIQNPFRLGANAARADDYECIDWNKGSKVPHILATGSSGGFVTVWDVRGKKENLTLNNYGRKAVSAVSWDPNMATRLITAIPNDQDPLILMWDLRNSNAPEKILRGHELGVLSLSWCGQDSELLLSCGKDNRTICWNPYTGQPYGEFPVVTNWTFQTRWNPHNPGLFATASFDGKIAVNTLQNTNPQADNKPAAAPVDGEDFFAQAQNQSQTASFSLAKAPKWMERPVSVSFGFGGKLVRLSTDSTTKKSKVSIETFAVDSAITEASEKFESALQKGDLQSICEFKVSDATTDEEKADWQVIETLNAGKSRKKLREYLGFADDVDDLTKKTSELDVNGEADKEQVNGTKDDDDFFGKSTEEDSDNFLADLAATKGAKTNAPFHIMTGEESDAEKGISRALMLGKFEDALDICLKEGHMSDAFMIAICGGQKCIDKAQTAYLRKKAQGPNYLRLLASIVGKNLWDVVHNADLSNWKEVMATLCTYADETEFSDLCEALGDRLEESMTEGGDNGTLRRDASFCYLAGSKLEKVVNIWLSELQENETAGLKAADKEGESSFSVHARSLQDFIEKVTVFRKVVNFQDADRQSTSNWKLEPLYARYTEYADILAAHGQLQVAEKYLDLLPSKYPAAEIAQQRVKLATRKAPTQRQTAAASRAAPRVQPVMPGLAPTPAPVMSAPNAAPSAYAPTSTFTPAASANPYAPPAQQFSPYQPAGTPSQPSAYNPPSQFGMAYGQPQQQAPLPPPPRAGTVSPSAPPPSKASNMSNWNDLPETFAKQANSRRGTPGPATVISPFPNQPSIMSPPPPPAGFQQKPVTSLPPPPKAGQATPRVASPLGGTNAYERPSSSAASAYAPAQPSTPAGTTLPPPVAPPVMRGPSPYNPPPSAVAAQPPSNRYAPAPSAQVSTPSAAAPPPPRSVAPPPNPYAPSAFPYAPQLSQPGPYGQPSQSAPYGGQPPAAVQPPPQRAPVAPPPQGPPRAAPPLSGPPQGPPQASAPPQRPAPPESRPSTAPRISTPAPAKYRK